jgi:hypothetical protein
VRRPPSRPLEHSQELASAADTAHGFPFLAGFLGGKHRLVDCAKFHFALFSSILIKPRRIAPGIGPASERSAHIASALAAEGE